MSIESIWSVVGVLEPNSMSDSETTDSLDSPGTHDLPLSNLDPALATSPATGLASSPSETTITRDTSLSVAGLDVHSCLQFLLDLYRQWLLPGSSHKPSLMLLNEVIKSVSRLCVAVLLHNYKSCFCIVFISLTDCVSNIDLILFRYRISLF